MKLLLLCASGQLELPGAMFAQLKVSEFDVIIGVSKTRPSRCLGKMNKFEVILALYHGYEGW